LEGIVFVAAITDFYNDNRKTINNALSILGWLVIALLFFLSIQERLADLRLARLVQTLITGLLIGGVYALIALGIVIINKASGVFNFAHGHMMLVGGFVFFSFFANASVNLVVAAIYMGITALVVLSMNGWREIFKPANLIAGVVVSVVCVVLMTLPNTPGNLLPQFTRAIVGSLVGMVLLGLLVERFTIRPLIGQPLFAKVLMTLAVSQVLLGVANLIWGSTPVPLTIFSGLQSIGIPNAINIPAEALGGTINIRTPFVFVFILALVAFVGFVLFFRYTNVGLAMRASAENQTLSQSLGMRVRLILAIAWGIASILAATAGVLQGGASQLDLNLPLLALRAFPAVLLGGLESITGALVGGLAIGLAQELGNLFFPGLNVGNELAPYVVLMVILVLRPQGLFGEKIIERI
jgi:branched-chain amino acid transport system permease protein